MSLRVQTQLDPTELKHYPVYLPGFHAHKEMKAITSHIEGLNPPKTIITK